MLIHPCHHHRGNVAVGRPLQPLTRRRLRCLHRTDTHLGVRLESITYAITRQVTRHKDDAALGHRYITESWVHYFEQWMQHVLHRVSALAELVKHHDDGLVQVELEACVGVVPCCLGIVVDDRHCDVTEVHVGHVDVTGSVACPLLQHLDDARLAYARLALQHEAVGGARKDQVCGLFQGHGVTDIYLCHVVLLGRLLR